MFGFLKRERRFRVLYLQENGQYAAALPMSRQTAESYFAIFGDAAFLVEVIKEKPARVRFRTDRVETGRMSFASAD